MEAGRVASNESTSYVPLQQTPSDIYTHHQGTLSPQRAKSPEKQLQLDDFFANSKGRTVYSDQEIQAISRLLALSSPPTQNHASRSEVPRLYIVLRIIGQLESLDSIIENGFTDVGFPFTHATVPKGFNVT